MERVLVVFNPAARRGRAASRKRRLVESLRSAGVPYDLVETTAPGDARSLAATAHERGYGIILVAGGDGTMNETVNGMAEAALPGALLGKLALFAAGTGNDLAHALGAAKSPQDVAAAIANGRTRRIDLGVLNVRNASGTTLRRYFANNAGIGLEASVTVESRHVKRLSGSLLYLAAALRALRSYRTPQADIVWETDNGDAESVSRRISLISVGNSMRAGGGFRLTPDAQLDDGMFDAAIADALSRRRVLLLLPLALFGKHTGNPAVRMLRCRRLHVRFDEPLPVHLDGEVVSTDAVEVEVEIEPGRLELAI